MNDTMMHHSFFGYGSLVNRSTHSFTVAYAAQAQGWRRAWRFTDDRKVSFLTVIRDPQATIDGLVAEVAVQDWPLLDQREHAYERLTATDCVRHGGPADHSVALYAIAPDRLNLPDADHPVLLSYIDVVVQGFLREFGPTGADRFFDTTTGWEAPILDDRTTPRYPRAVRLSDAERAVVDSALLRLNCRRVLSC